jgi:hypothetical protein
MSGLPEEIELEDINVLDAELISYLIYIEQVEMVKNQSSET